MPERILRLWVVGIVAGWIWVNYDERDMPKKNSPILFDDPEELQAEEEEREPSLDDADCSFEEVEEEADDIAEDELDDLDDSDDGPEDFDF